MKKIIIFAVIGCLTWLNTHTYLQAGFPYTHDGENHLARFANYKIAVKEGQIPPRFAPNLMNHYGYPVFNYNYPLANLLSLPFSVVKFNYELTFKIIAVSFVILSLSGMYLWALQLTKSWLIGLWTVAIFGSAPYLLATIAYRGNIGEIMALGLLPWLLLSIEKIKDHQLRVGTWTWLLRIGLWTAFSLSHNVTFMFGLPLLLLYAGLRLKLNLKYWQTLIPILILSGLLSCWFWLPAIFEQSAIVIGQANLSTTFARHFPTLTQLLFSPFQFGFSQAGPIDSLAFNLGPLQNLILFLATLAIVQLLIKTRSLKNISGWWLALIISSWILFGLQLAGSQWLWSILPILRFIQFPWRLSLFLTITIAGLGGYCVALIPKKGQLLLGLVLVWQVLVLLKIRPVDYFHRSNETYEAFSQSTSTANENLPRTFTYLDIGDWQPGPSLIQGDGAIKVDDWRGSDRGYELLIKEKSIIVEPTMQFLGWETWATQGDQATQLHYLDSSVIQGRIAYELDPGQYHIRTRFTQNTWARRVGNGLTIGAILLTIIIFWLLENYEIRNTNDVDKII